LALTAVEGEIRSLISPEMENDAGHHPKDWEVSNSYDAHLSTQKMRNSGKQMKTVRTRVSAKSFREKKLRSIAAAALANRHLPARESHAGQLFGDRA
jgi:hypothetical protein